MKIPLEQLYLLKRYACHYCEDYAAEYADISFGGIGAGEGWTTVILIPKSLFFVAAGHPGPPQGACEIIFESFLTAKC